MYKILKLIFIFRLMVPWSSGLSAQSVPSALSQTLLFAAQAQYDGLQNMFAYADAQTLEVSIFYEDKEALLLRPLSWSPDGSLLAFLRVTPGQNNQFLTQICTLTQERTLQTCFEDLPPNYSDIYTPLYTITWADDRHLVYFVAQDGEMLRLVEADAFTGEHRRTNFEHSSVIPDSDEKPTLKWTKNLNFILVDTGVYPGESNVVVTDLRSGENWVIERPALPEGASDELFTVCNFSPQGSFLTALMFRPYNAGTGSRLIIFDTEGAISHVLDTNIGNKDTFFQCPHWETSESSFLVVGIEEPDNLQRHVLRYVLESNSLEQLEQDTFDLEIMGSLQVSTDKRFLAFTVPAGIHLGSHYYAVAVLYPTGEVRQFREPFYSVSDPLWIPLGTN